jgi:hypothetical protein
MNMYTKLIMVIKCFNFYAVHLDVLAGHFDLDPSASLRLHVNYSRSELTFLAARDLSKEVGRRGRI